VFLVSKGDKIQTILASRIAPATSQGKKPDFLKIMVLSAYYVSAFPTSRLIYHSMVTREFPDMFQRVTPIGESGG
jgi:hypothetical protein